ncbi:MAG: ABC transporter substrate-binding protein [Rubrivivax sp.]
MGRLSARSALTARSGWAIFPALSSALPATLVGLLALTLPLGAAAAGQPAGAPVYIAFDGAYGVKTNTAPKAIERGIRAAMEEINARGGVLGGRPLQLLTSDNQGVSARARDNYLEYAARPDVIAVLGGKFSPVIVETVPEAQRMKVPLVSVWGSADPITDHGHSPSFVFRLSLKDSWGVEAMLRRATTAHKARRVCAVLPNTSWGRSGQGVITSRAGALGLTVVATRWYNWGDKAFGETIAACRAGEAQAMILVANEVEAALLVREMAALPAAERFPIVSHWGVTGGVMHELAADSLDKVDLQVIQTFTFVDNTRPRARQLAAWLLKEGGYTAVAQITSPVGSAHAYDMTHLLARAVDQARSTRGDDIRRALEKLPAFEGAVRTYAPAFAPDRHDALGPQQVLFVRIERSGALTPVR